MRPLLSLCLVALLASCANVSSDYRLNASSNKGLVVGTITYDTGLGMYSVFGNRLNSTSPETAFHFHVGESQWRPFLALDDKDLKATGGTFSAEVTEGDYIVTGWRVRKGAWNSLPNSPASIAFKVEAGKITYLGNFHFQENGEVTLQDMASRDLPVLKSRLQAVATAPVAFSVAPGTKIENIAGALTRSIDWSSVYIPIIRAK